MELKNLSKDQVIQLKQRLHCERNENVSYGELVDIDNLVSDDEVKKAIEKSADVNIKVDDWKIQDKVNELLKDNSINWKDLL